MDSTNLQLTAVVIDNDPQLREFLAARMAEMGYRVHMAGTAADGVRLARRHHPDLVTTELHLSSQSGSAGADGLDAIRQIQTFSDAYVLIITGSTDPLDLCMGLETMADDYIVKPFSPMILQARIAALARRPRNKKSPAPPPKAPKAPEAQ